MDSGLLTSRSSWKILGVFLERPWEQLYTRELIKETNISPNTAVKIMKDMKKAGIFTSQKIGNVIAYKLNENNEVSKKLLALYHEKRLQQLAEEFKLYITRLRRKLENKNIISVVLFGSVSKGKAGRLSDIDILIIREGKFDKRQISDIFEKYSRYIQVIDFTKDEFIDRYEKGNELVINMLKSGIIIYDRDFYCRYLFKPIPKPAKDYIEDILKDADKELENLWEMYRKENNTRLMPPLLHPMINKVSTALILLNKQIPESRKDMIKRLEKLKERRLSEWFKKTRRIWDGEMLQLSKREIEEALNLARDKLEECYMKLEWYDG